MPVSTERVHVLVIEAVASRASSDLMLSYDVVTLATCKGLTPEELGLTSPSSFLFLLIAGEVNAMYKR